MIAYLQGQLLELSGNSCLVLSSGGVGYELFLPAHLLASLPERGNEVSFYTCLVQREDAQELFGFASWDERCTFTTLLSISKVGSRTALNILSTFRPDELRQLVQEGDSSALTAVSGIGQKSAQRIFWELKDKIKAEPLSSAASKPGLAAPGSLYRDALTGLLGLGYSEEEAGPPLKAVLHAEPDLDMSSALRATLKELAKGKER